jgi:hypothetical protein
VADVEEYALAAIRKYIERRRQDIAGKFPKNLRPDEYAKHCGRHEELEAFADAVKDAIRKANDAGRDDAKETQDE